MIVKIQRSQPPTRQGFVLVYGKSLTYCWQGKIDPDVDKWMGRRQKVFAYAHIDGAKIVINGEAPHQKW